MRASWAAAVWCVCSIIAISLCLLGGCAEPLEVDTTTMRQDLAREWVWEGYAGIELFVLRPNGTYSRWGLYDNDMMTSAEDDSVLSYYSLRRKERYGLPPEIIGHWELVDDHYLVLHREVVWLGEDWFNSDVTSTFRIERVADKELLVRLVRVKYSYQREAHERDMLGFHFTGLERWVEMSEQERASYYEECDPYYPSREPFPLPWPFRPEQDE